MSHHRGATLMRCPCLRITTNGLPEGPRAKFFGLQESAGDHNCAEGRILSNLARTNEAGLDEAQFSSLPPFSLVVLTVSILRTPYSNIFEPNVAFYVHQGFPKALS